MKKCSARIVALLLTFVMLLGAVPFVSAEDLAITGEIVGPDTAWAGSTVTGLYLTLDGIPSGEGYSKSVRWDTGYKAETSYSCDIPADAVGSHTVTCSLTVEKAATVVASETFTHTITLLTPAGSDFAILGGASSVKANESARFETTGENDSKVEWSVSPATASISGGRFSASEPGTYTVTATAKNGGAHAAVTDSVTVEVTDAAYTVRLSNRTVSLSDEDPYLTYSVVDAEGNDVTDQCALSFTSANPAVAQVDNAGNLTLFKVGTADITLTAEIGGEKYSTTATVTVTNAGAITCPQDYTETSGDSLEMEFRLNGVKTEDVSWSVSVTGEEEFSHSDVEENGSEASVEIYADDGIGIAEVHVTANWAGGGEASATFYVSFYTSINKTVVVKDGVDEFDFDETNVFSSFSGSSNPAKQTLHSLLTDGCGTDVIISETSSRNSRVGKITYNKTSSDRLSAYDPDEDNDYATSKVGNLHFEVLGAGEYEINIEIYRPLGYSGGLATTKGSITIVTGGGTSSDIEYSTVPSGTVKFKADDFDDFWEDHVDSSSSKKSEALNYVTFEVATASDMEGKLTVSGTEVKATTKFADTTISSRKIYDLDDLTYTASSTKSYTDYVTFICYGEDGTKISGVVSVDVGSNDVSFTDVKTSDWFYSSVAYVCNNGIMNGTSTTTFAPNTKLSRAMVATVLYRMAGSPSVGGDSPFTDVKDTGSWYYKAVIWAQKNGIVTGTSATTFAPNNNITRQDLALMLYRFAKYQGKSTAASGSLSSFSDSDKVGSWASDALRWAVGQGIVTGSAGKLNPTGTASRAEAAAMLQRYDTTVGSGSSDEDEVDTVYVVRSTSTYHYDEDCAGKNAIEKSLASAKKSYDPCEDCVD